MLQCSQKESFRPETGPEFPQKDKNPKHSVNGNLPIFVDVHDVKATHSIYSTILAMKFRDPKSADLPHS